jgi:hypothetical protein
MKKTRCLLFFAAVMITLGCKKPYAPPAIATAGSYLVIEGGINSGSDSTIITLSKTVKLSSATTINPLTNAVVAVQSDKGATYPLAEISAGKYVSPGLNLNTSNNYRLSITTADNKQYYSDYVAVLTSPPIDSIYFRITNNAVNVYSATHDPSNSVKYFRWDYNETWIIHPEFDSHFISNGDTVLPRPVSQQIYTCWQTDTSSTIILGSSAKLSSDVIVDNPITILPSNSPKIASEYSILVRQYALTGDAYSFWTNLKKNTEQLGSIFDAQPSQINGNIHSATNPGEPVIGYISASSVTSERIFITIYQLPAWPANSNFPPNCQLTPCLYAFLAPGSTIPVNQVDEFINYNRGASFPLIPVDVIQPPGAPAPLGYSASTPECVDCTLHGTNKEPAFWKYYP